MREKNRNTIENIKKLPQFTTMNVIDGQAGLASYSSLIFYSLTIDNILNIVVLLILAAVTISALSGDNGILSNATNAKKKTEEGDVEEQIKLALSEWQIERYTGTKGLQEYLEGKFESVTDNGDGTYTVELDGYEAIVDENGSVVGEIGKAGPRPVVDETSIKITLEDGTTVPAEGELTIGTKLKITFTASVEGGTTTITPSVPYTTDGTETEVEFTIVGTINGENTKSVIKKISVASKYKIDHSEVIVPTIAKTGNFANSNIAEVREGNIPIPTGFEYVKGDRQGGAVIRNTSSTDSSEFVWVPVVDVTKMYGTLEDGTKAGKIYNWNSLDSNGNPANLNWTEATTDGKTEMSIGLTSGSGSYREPDTVLGCDRTADYLNIIKGILTNEQSNYASMTAFKTTMQNDFKSMIESVEKYGGFYIARYEMSLNSTTKKAEFIKNATSTNASNTDSYRWYGLYARAKEYSTSSTQGSMVWGSQYDAMLKWMKENNVNVTNATPIKGAVKNSDSERRTGYVETDKILNIYDILGNSFEWTLEASNTAERAKRGGFYNSSGSPSSRNYTMASENNGYYSTRATLYIRWH